MGQRPTAIVAGALCAWLLATPSWTGHGTKWVLSASVVGLGASMNLSNVLATGLNGLLLTVGTLILTFGVGVVLSRRLGLSRDVATLITVGTAICGGSAIAAVAPLLRARAGDIATSLGVVFILNAVALYIFPVVGQALQMDAESFGLWCAFAIHDTSSVVGAAATHSPEALEIATVTKLGRALWIVPLGLVVPFFLRGESQTEQPRGRVAVPLFIWAFLLMVLLVTVLPAARPAGLVVSRIARHGLVLALFLIGLSLDRQTLRQISGRALILGVSLWVVLGVATLAYFR